jgi:hypothetical protein
MGSFVQHLGNMFGFLLLAGASSTALVALCLAFSETKPAKYDD